MARTKAKVTYVAVFKCGNKFGNADHPIVKSTYEKAYEFGFAALMDVWSLRQIGQLTITRNEGDKSEIVFQKWLGMNGGTHNGKYEGEQWEREAYRERTEFDASVSFAE